jgi:hypothetical protein
MKTKLPKQYLSYSAIDLWYKNKPEFRKRYYEGKKPIETRYTIYGKTAHESIDKDPELAHIPRLETKEHDIRVNIGDVPIRGFIDTFNPNTNQFYEYKTGLKMADGGSRWTIDKVNNHRQLPFYSLLIREKYGSYNPNTLLILLETDWVKDSIKHGGVEVIISEELKLTGRCEMFMRKITDKELDETKDWLLKAAEEIVTDFDWWKHVNGKRSLTS